MYVMNMETCTILRELFPTERGGAKAQIFRGGKTASKYQILQQVNDKKILAHCLKHFHGVRQAASFSQGQVPHHGASIRGGNGEDEDVPHTHLQGVPKHRKTYRVFFLSSKCQSVSNSDT